MRSTVHNHQQQKGPAPLPPAAIARQEGFDLVYHLLHMGNLPSVLEHGLMPRTALREAGILAHSLQSPAVRDERARMVRLPDGTERSLESFLPLRWDPRTPVLANLAYDWEREEYQLDRQRFLVIMAARVEALDQATTLWFATGHPFALTTRFYGTAEWANMPWEELRRGRQTKPGRPAPAAEGELLFDGRVDPSYLAFGAVCCEESRVRAQALAPGFPIRVVREFFFGEEES